MVKYSVYSQKQWFNQQKNELKTITVVRCTQVWIWSDRDWPQMLAQHKTTGQFLMFAGPSSEKLPVWSCISRSLSSNANLDFSLFSSLCITLLTSTSAPLCNTRLFSESGLSLDEELFPSQGLGSDLWWGIKSVLPVGERKAVVGWFMDHVVDFSSSCILQICYV